MTDNSIVNAVNPYLSDVGVGLVFGLGYYFIKYVYGEKGEEKKETISLSKSTINYTTCKSIEDFNQIIKANEDNTKLIPFEVIQKMRETHLFPDINTYNNLLNCCFIQGKFENAEKLTEDLFDFASPCQPDLSTFNILLKGISCKLEFIPYNKTDERSAQIKNLDKILIQMKKLSDSNSAIKPNDVTINTCLDILIKTGDTDRAWEMFETMNTVYNIKPDKYSFSTIIKALKFDPNPEKLEKAFGIIDFLKTQKGSSSNDEIIFNCLIDVCVKLGLISKAEKLFSEMKELKIDPTKVTYAIMIKGYGQIYKLDKAFKIFEEMKLSSLPPNEIIYGCLLNACVRCSNIQKVTEVYREMKQHHLEMNIILYTTLIKAYTKVKDLSSALDVYYTMLSDEKVKPNIVIHNAMLDCCVECGNTKKLNDIYQTIKDKVLEDKNENVAQPDLITYSTVIKGHARAKDMEKVFDIYRFLKENSDQFCLDEIIFNSVLDGCAKTNNIEKGLEVYQDMQNLGIQKSNVTYSILIKIYSNAKQEENALAILDEMLKKGIKPGVIVYTCLIQTCLKAKKLQKAINLFENVKLTIRPDHVLFNTIINGCVYHHDYDLAAKYLLESLHSNIKIANDLYNMVLFKLTCHYCYIPIEKKVEYASQIIMQMKGRGLEIQEDTNIKVAKMIYQSTGNEFDFNKKPETTSDPSEKFNKFSNNGYKKNNYYNNKEKYNKSKNDPQDTKFQRGKNFNNNNYKNNIDSYYN